MPDNDKPVRALPAKDAEDYFRTYANNISFELSAYDLTLVFGDLTRSEQEKETLVTVENHTAVRLAWAQAKVAAILMGANVNLYEKRNGAIRIPKGMIPNFVADEDNGLPLVEILPDLIKNHSEDPKD